MSWRRCSPKGCCTLLHPVLHLPHLQGRTDAKINLGLKFLVSFLTLHF